MSSGFKTFLIFLAIIPMGFLVAALVFGAGYTGSLISIERTAGFFLALFCFIGTIYSASSISRHWFSLLPQSKKMILIYVLSIIVPWFYTIVFLFNN